MGARVSVVRFWAVTGLLFSSLGWSQSTPAPTVTLTTSASSIAAGKTARLSWTTTNASRCVGSGSGWSQTYEGTAAARGSFTSAALNDRSNVFILSCTGPGGSATQSVTVLALPKPEVTLTANPDRALPGGAVVLSWQSTDATSCSASGAPFTGAKPPSGSETLRDLTKGTKKFSLSCKGVGGTTRVTRDVAVVPAPTLTFSASKTQIAENTGTQIKWKATDATSCLASDDWDGAQNTSGSVNTGNLTSDKTYTLTCTGLNGEVEKTVTVEVVDAPIVSLAISDDIVAPGESVTISWDVDDAQSCTASGSPFTGSKNATGGTETLSNLTKGAKTFKLTCKGGGGTTAAEANLTVIAPPTLTFSASKTQIPANTATQLRWKATDATTCVASGDWSGERALSGSASTGSLSSDKGYTLTCTGPNGEDEKTVTVEVVPAPVVTLELSETLVEPGTAVTVSWQAEYATSCTASGSGWTGSKAAEGTETVSFPTAGKRTFELRCTGAGGRTAATPLELSVFPKPNILSFEAKPLLVQIGQTTSLTWRTENAKSCTASGDWSVGISPSGTWTSGALTKRTNTFILTCTGDGGEVSEEVVVTAEGAPEVTLSVDRALVLKGEKVTLTWKSQNATACSAGGNGWSGSKALSGSEVTNALEVGRYTYDLNCTNAVGSERKSVTVDVVVPQISVSPTSFDFGEVRSNGSETRKAVLKNTGRVALEYRGATLNGAGSDQFAVTTSCGASLAPDAECELTLSFKPTRSGVSTAQLDVQTNAQPVVIGLTGRGVFFPLTVTKSGTGSGTVISSPAGINCGSSCQANFDSGTRLTLTATAANDSTFTGWSGACTGTDECIVTMSEARNVTATFALKKFNLTVAKAGTGSGTVTSTPAGIDCGNTCSSSYTAGAVVKLVAIAATDSAFAGWSGACTGTGECAVTMDQAKTVQGDFQKSNVQFLTPREVVVGSSWEALKLGPSNLGSPLSELISVKNTGENPIAVDSVQLSDDSSKEFFLVKDDCENYNFRRLPTKLINPGSSCTIQIYFAPKTPEKKFGRLIIKMVGIDILGKTSGQGSTEVSVSGQPVTPVIALSPATVSFQAEVGQSTEEVITVAQGGEGQVSFWGNTLKSLAVSGDGAKNYKIVNNCGLGVAIQQKSCLVRIIYNPSSAGSHPAQLRFDFLEIGSKVVTLASTAFSSITRVAKPSEIVTLRSGASSHHFGYPTLLDLGPSGIHLFLLKREHIPGNSTWFTTYVSQLNQQSQPMQEVFSAPSSLKAGIYQTLGVVRDALFFSQNTQLTNRVEIYNSRDIRQLEFTLSPTGGIQWKVLQHEGGWNGHVFMRRPQLAKSDAQPFESRTSIGGQGNEYRANDLTFNFASGSWKLGLPHRITNLGPHYPFCTTCLPLAAGAYFNDYEAIHPDAAGQNWGMYWLGVTTPIQYVRKENLPGSMVRYHYEQSIEFRYRSFIDGTSLQDFPGVASSTKRGSVDAPYSTDGFFLGGNAENLGPSAGFSRIMPQSLAQDEHRYTFLFKDVSWSGGEGKSNDNIVKLKFVRAVVFSGAGGPVVSSAAAKPPSFTLLDSEPQEIDLGADRVVQSARLTFSEIDDKYFLILHLKRYVDKDTGKGCLGGEAGCRANINVQQFVEIQEFNFETGQLRLISTSLVKESRTGSWANGVAPNNWGVNHSVKMDSVRACDGYLYIALVEGESFPKDDFGPNINADPTIGVYRARVGPECLGQFLASASTAVVNEKAIGSISRVIASPAVEPRKLSEGGGMTKELTEAIEVREVDVLTGSQYQLRSRVDAAEGQTWQIDYLDSGGTVLDSARLPPTSVVAWRRADRRAVDLPTTAWVRLCGTQLFTIQDGYQLLAGGRSRTLQNGWQSEIVVNGGAEVVLVTGVSCSGEGLTVSGYAFGVSAYEPPLSDGSVSATAFELKLDPLGLESARKREIRPISVGEICALPRATELEGFCRAAAAALR
jgi:hypothetical protein